MSDHQLEMFSGPYVLGKTKDTNDLWTSAGLFGESVTELLGFDSKLRVSTYHALQQAAVLICLDVMAQDISKATLRLRRRVKTKGEFVVEPKQHKMAEMLALEPNVRHTWVEFHQMLVYHLCLASNSYCYVRRNGAGDPLELIPIVPNQVQEFINERSREVFYDLNASSMQEIALLGREYIRAPERDVLHVRNRMLDGFWGFSTLTAGGPTITLGKDIERYQRSLYSENGMVRGFFQRTGAGMSDDGFRRTKGQLKKLLQRRMNIDDPILLEDGITYKEMAMKATEAEMIKALDKHIEMVCKLWRMPPHKAMHLTAVKYENLTAMENMYVRDTLIPICRLIEDRMERTLLTREERLEYRLEFDRDELKIIDEKVENDRAQKAAQSGLITINEWRDGQGYNPASWGNVRIIPVNTALIDEKNEVVATGAVAQEEPENNGDDDAGDGEGTEPKENKSANDDRRLRLVASAGE
jgi:HK97 family phage portal protein